MGTHMFSGWYCLLDSEFTGNEESNNLVIPGVLCKDELSEIEVKHIGIGQIGVRLTRILMSIDASAVPDLDFANLRKRVVPNRKRKSISDPEDISESLSNQCDSSGEESQSTNSSMTILGTCDDQLAFHVFHDIFLIHWILLCELEAYDKPVDEPKVETKAKRRSEKTGPKNSAREDEIKAEADLLGVLSECQGTGISIEGDELEKPYCFAF
ncbi:hypothetical protein HAX54_036470 [Datura stramonium]|uniref:Uncharacterized protein n=1 Tax=Datura stramonium TaxID=4076 RepID=A0ABS8VGY3_DATST|nr:hypothetical protein [Datura stramonium]